jgi:hypothetical protein
MKQIEEIETGITKLKIRDFEKAKQKTYIKTELDA